MNCLAPAQDYEIQDIPLKVVQKIDSEHGSLGRDRVPLRLALGVLNGDWVKAWWDGKVAWAVSPTSGPSQPKQPKAARSPVQANEDGLRQAVERGGGQLRGARREATGWNVLWARHGVNYQSRVDFQLNVITAGFCLSGGDRAQDLTTLVSLVEGKESLDADPRVWRGDPGW
jgi:hypothetical protein